MSGYRPFVLSIAGFDPSAGAGVLADVKTFEQHGVYGLAICTGLTLQTENEFHSVEWRKLKDVIIKGGSEVTRLNPILKPVVKVISGDPLKFEELFQSLVHLEQYLLELLICWFHWLKTAQNVQFVLTF